MRKIVQIAVIPRFGGSDTFCSTETGCLALCDDGSIWEIYNNTPNDEWNKEWFRLPDIPQDPEPVRPEGTFNEEGKFVIIPISGVIECFDGYKIIHHERKGRMANEQD